MRNNKITGIRNTISSLHRYLANTHWGRGQCAGLALPGRWILILEMRILFLFFFVFSPMAAVKIITKTRKLSIYFQVSSRGPEKHLNRNLLQFSTSNILNTSNRRKLIQQNARQVVKITVNLT